MVREASEDKRCKSLIARLTHPSSSWLPVSDVVPDLALERLEGPSEALDVYPWTGSRLIKSPIALAALWVTRLLQKDDRMHR